MPFAQPIPDDRPLTDREKEVVAWLLDHGDESCVELLPQLETARVVSRCPCGCASIDFSIGGVRPLTSGMVVVSDFWWKTRDGHICGAFIFTRDNLLAGLEVWSVDGDIDVTPLPELDALLPMPPRSQ